MLPNLPPAHLPSSTSELYNYLGVPFNDASIVTPLTPEQKELFIALNKHREEQLKHKLTKDQILNCLNSLTIPTQQLTPNSYYSPQINALIIRRDNHPPIEFQFDSSNNLIDVRTPINYTPTPKCSPNEPSWFISPD